MKNHIFSSEIVSGFGEPGGTSQPRIPRRIPRRLLSAAFCFLLYHAEERLAQLDRARPPEREISEPSASGLLVR